MPKTHENNAGFLIIKDDRDCNVLSWESVTANGAKEMKYRVAGRCMSPLLIPGDELEIDKLNEPARSGWIVTFHYGRRILTHRVIKTRDDLFWARGDMSAGVQGPIGPEDTIGRVTAVWRDGTRHNLSGLIVGLGGLARNLSMAALRKIAARHPHLRRFVEIEVLSSRHVRLVLRQLTKALFGDVTVVEQRDKLKIAASIMSGAEPWREDIAAWMESKLNKEQMRAFSARLSRRPIVVGSVVLVEDDYRNLGKIGYVGWLVVQLGFRGAGVGRKLLKALEDGSRESGRELLIAEVMPDNTRSLGLFRSMGYREATGKEIDRWPKKLRGRLLEGRVVVVKNL